MRLKRWANPASEVPMAQRIKSPQRLGCADLLEDLRGLAMDVEYASELSCTCGRDLRLPDVIAISQSGETSDTLAALTEARLEDAGHYQHGRLHHGARCERLHVDDHVYI